MSGLYRCLISVTEFFLVLLLGTIPLSAHLGEWDGPRRLISLSSASTYGIAIGSDNNLALIFSNERESGLNSPELYCQGLTNFGRSRTQKVRLTTDSQPYPNLVANCCQSAIIDSFNTIHVVYTHFDVNDPFIESIRYFKLNDRCQRVGSEITVTPNARDSYQEYPAIALASDESIYIVYSRSSTTGVILYFRSVDSAGNLGPERQLVTGDAGFDYRISTYGTDFFLVRQNSLSRTYEIQKFSRDGQPLSPLVPYLTFTTSDPSSFDVDSSGNVHIIYRDANGISYRRYDGNLNPLGSVISLDRYVNTFDPALSSPHITTKDNKVYAIWTAAPRGSFSSEIRHVILDINGNIFQPKTTVTHHLLSSTGGSDRGTLTVDSNGVEHMVYHTTEDVYHELHYQRGTAPVRVVVSSNLLPLPGRSVPLMIQGPSNVQYVLVASLSAAEGFFINQRHQMGLRADLLFFLSFLGHPYFSNFQGTLDPQGMATATVNIPQEARDIEGVRLWFSAVAYTPNQIIGASPPVPIVLRNRA